MILITAPTFSMSFPLLEKHSNRLVSALCSVIIWLLKVVIVNTAESQDVIFNYMYLILNYKINILL